MAAAVYLASSKGKLLPGVSVAELTSHLGLEMKPFFAVVEGKGLGYAGNQIRNDLGGILVKDWSVFLPATVINIAFCPPELRVLFSCSIDGRVLVWNKAEILQKERVGSGKLATDLIAGSNVKGGPLHCLAWDSRRPSPPLRPRCLTLSLLFPSSTMISALLLINQRGEVVIYRVYRGDVSTSTADAFRMQVIAKKETHKPPIQLIDGSNFLHTRHGDLHLYADPGYKGCPHVRKLPGHPQKSARPESTAPCRHLLACH